MNQGPAWCYRCNEELVRRDFDSCGFVIVGFMIERISDRNRPESSPIRVIKLKSKCDEEHFYPK